MPQPKQQTKATIIKAEWSNLTVEYGRMEEAGEYDFTMPKNAISVAFAPHERVTWSVDGEAPRTTSLPAGSVFLYSEREFVWHRREKASEYVNLMLEPQLINQLADDNGITTSIDLEHKVIFSDPTILHVAQLLKSEAINGGLSGNLYVESLRNLLAIHLLRNYTGVKQKSSPEAGVLDTLKLQEIKDYIEENLAEELTIANLAGCSDE